MTTARAGSTKESELRQRVAKANTNPEGTNKTSQASTISTAAADKAQSSITVLDVVRACVGLALVTSIASYAVTGGTSKTFGLLGGNRPWFLNSAAVKAKFNGPLELTNDELLAYDGSDEGKPILLALNRTIYDVSSSPHVYGPGGMYSSLAAKDASRSYITTCFDPTEDLVPYFGGVHEVYVPLWLSKKPWKEELEEIGKSSSMFGGRDGMDLIDDLQKKVGRKHVKKLQKEAYEEAHVKVQEQVQNWERMFANKNYPVVGKVVAVDEGDENKWRHLGFCEAARKLRPNMAISLQRAMEATGKGDQMNINMGNMKAQAASKNSKDKKKKTKKDVESADNNSMGNTDNENNDKANVKMEDMMPGGKFFGKGKKGEKDNKHRRIVEEQVRQKVADGDADKAKEDIEQLKEDHGGKEPRIPDAVPQAVLNDEQRAGL